MSQIDPIKITEIQSAARRALISTHPGYFSLSERDQENFRANKNEQALQKIKIVLINSLFGLKCNISSVEAIYEELSNIEINILNWARLLTDGVGDDFIFVNESFAEGTTILNFSTLYDYDFNNYLFQEKSNKERSLNHQYNDYFPFRWTPWIRLLINDVFSYGTLTSLASHINEAMEDFGDNYIEQLIPNKLIKGKNHGKSAKHGFQWDMEIDASGMEGQLEELKTRWQKYLEQRWLDINRSQSKLEPLVYIEDDDTKQVTHRTFIFNNADALKRVRWRHFLSDTLPLVVQGSNLQELISSEVIKSRKFLDDSYEGIMNNFEPKLVKLKRKMTVIVPPEFFNDLDDIDE